MSQLQSDKSNIAWFKLAEFVSRKEKERALGIYKLLVHSLPHEALAAQLEGDLLLAFHDDKALQSYTRAVELYERSEDFIKALAVCVHCLTLMPDSVYHIEHAMRLYLMIGEPERALHYAYYLGKILGTKSDFERCQTLITDHNLDQKCRIHMTHSFIVEVLSNKSCDAALLEKPLIFVLDGYSAESTKKLSSFMSTLELLDGDVHTWAKKYLKKQISDETDDKK